MSQKGQGNHLSKMIMMATKHLAGTSGTSSPAPPYCFASSHIFAVAKNLLAMATKFVATAAKFRHALKNPPERRLRRAFPLKNPPELGRKTPGPGLINPRGRRPDPVLYSPAGGLPEAILKLIHVTGCEHFIE